MPRKHSILKNRKIRFREADYVEKNYIRDGKAVIPIKLNSIKELYMKHDYKNLALSDELCAYIEEIAYIIPFEYSIELEIHCPQISLEEQDRIRKVIKNNYGMEIDDRDYDVKEANKKSTFLFILGFGEKHHKVDDFLGNYVAICGSGTIFRLETFLAEGKPIKKHQCYL